MATFNASPADQWAAEWEPTLKQTAAAQTITMAFSFIFVYIRLNPVIKGNQFGHVFQYPAVFLGAFYMLLHCWNYLHYFVASDAMERDIWLITMVSMTISKNFIYLFLMLQQSSLKLGCGTMFQLILFDAVHISQWVMTLLMITDIHLTPSATHELSYRTFGERGIVGLCGYNLIDAVSAFIALLLFLGKSRMGTERAKPTLKAQKQISEALSRMNVAFGTQLVYGVSVLFASILLFFASEFLKASVGLPPALNQSTDHFNIYLLCITCFTKLMPLLVGAYLLVAITAYAPAFTLQLSKLLAGVSGLCNQAIQQHFIKAVQTERTELIKQMVLHHPTLNLSATTFEDGNSVLHMAAILRNHDLIHYWIDMGLSPDQQNEKGDTPLHIASRVGDADSVSYLMHLVADIKAPNHEKETALSIAQSGGYTEVVEALSDGTESGAGPVVYPLDEVSQHNSMKKGIWIIIGGKVYDITQFLKNMLHPAGKAAIKRYYGRDATEAFDAVFHSKDAYKLLATYEIGTLEGFEAQKPALESEADDIDLIPPPMPELGRQNRIWVKELYLYPVKGCAGFTVDKAKLTRSGFANDRIYGFVNKATNVVVNQLKFPRLSTIQATFKSGCENCDEGIQLNDYFVPFMKEKALKVQWKSCTTPILVWDQGEAVSRWITEFLAPDAEKDDVFILTRLHEDNYRETEEYFALSFAPRSAQKISALQNYAAVLLISDESINELNRRYTEAEVQEKLSADDEKQIRDTRFRPNIVLSGLPAPHYEDFMKHITFGDVDDIDEEDAGGSGAEILWSRRRYVCGVPQVNQTSGVSTAEPTRTIRRYRNAITLNDRTSLPGDDAIFFGSFYGVKHSGPIEVGQSVSCEHSRLGYGDLRTSAGKSFYGLKDGNIGSQFALDRFAQYEEFELTVKQQVNHNVIRLRFKTRTKETEYHMSLQEALKMGDHYLLKYSDSDGNAVIRPYTPVFADKQESDYDDMTFDLLVKVYAKGKMSAHLNRMQCGDTILCKKNYGKICYMEPGKMRFGDPRITMFEAYTFDVKKLNLIAAGSGITPVYQILSNIHCNRKVDSTQIVCFYANVAMEDILLRDQLMEMDRSNPNISIHFVVERAPVNADADDDEKNVHRGRISADMCHEFLFPPEENEAEEERKSVVTLLCGPPPMENAVQKYIYNMGHHEKSVSTF